MSRLLLPPAGREVGWSRRLFLNQVEVGKSGFPNCSFSVFSKHTLQSVQRHQCRKIRDLQQEKVGPVSQRGYRNVVKCRWLLSRFERLGLNWRTFLRRRPRFRLFDLSFA